MSIDITEEIKPETKPNLTFQQLSKFINEKVAKPEGIWAGLPLPVQGLELVLEPRYPYQELTKSLSPEKVEEKQGIPFEYLLTAVNSWYSWKLNQIIYIYKIGNKVTFCREYLRVEQSTKLDMWLNALAVANEAWDWLAETKAMEKLSSLITGTAFKQYILTGTFIETSKKSGLTYLFRKGRPTIVLSPHFGENEMRVIGCLCLHPIGYYRETWCGAMVPTDDVIAHVLMMRGCEHSFWKKANNHHTWEIEAGL